MFTKSFTAIVVSLVLVLGVALPGCTPSSEEGGNAAHASVKPDTAPAAGLEAETSPGKAETPEAPPAASAGQSADPARAAMAKKTPEAAGADVVQTPKAIQVAQADTPADTSITGPKIHCDEPVYDFGRRDNMEKVEHDFVVKNIGTETLKLGRVKTSCGCTVAKPSKSTLEPGEESIISATLSLKGKEGQKTTVITVPSNDPETPNYQLKFTGVAVASIRIKPNSLNYGQVDADSLVEDKYVTIQSVEKDVSFNITSAQCTSPYFETEVEEVLPGKSYKITLKNTKPLEEGPIQGRVQITTDNPDRPVFSFSIYGAVRGDVAVIPERISVHYNEDPERRTSQYIRVVAGRVKEFDITEVISPLDEVEVDFSPRQAQFSEYLIKLTNMPVNGVLDGKELIIKTDIPSKPEIRVPFINKKTSRGGSLLRRPTVAPPVSRPVSGTSKVIKPTADSDK